MIASRDQLKKLAEDHVEGGDTLAAAEAWRNFKKARNTVNNRKKFEEHHFKSEKLLVVWILQPTLGGQLKIS